MINRQGNFRDENTKKSTHTCMCAYTHSNSHSCIQKDTHTNKTLIAHKNIVTETQSENNPCNYFPNFDYTSEIVYLTFMCC